MGKIRHLTKKTTQLVNKTTFFDIKYRIRNDENLWKHSHLKIHPVRVQYVRFRNEQLDTSHVFDKGRRVGEIPTNMRRRDATSTSTSTSTSAKYLVHRRGKVGTVLYTRIPTRKGNSCT